MVGVKRIESLNEIASNVIDSGNFGFCLRDFLDGFYANPDMAALVEAPAIMADALDDNGLADAYLAALAEHLCLHYGFKVPDWCQCSSRILKKPFFAAKSHGMRMILLQESPTSFRKRNIFISENALTRA